MAVSDNGSVWNEEEINKWNSTDNIEGPITMDNPEDMLKPWKHNSMFLDIVITHSVTSLIGLVGNVLVVVVMVGDRKSRNATNLFLVSLAVADLLLLLVCAPLQTVQYFVVQWDTHGQVCKMAQYAELLSAMSSVLNLSAVTLERFIVIVFPMKSRSLCTISNCRKAIILVWIVSMVLSIPIVFSKYIQPMTYTNNITYVTIHYCFDEENGMQFAIYQLIVLFVAPGLLMVVCYTYVIRELWRSTRNMKFLTNTSSANRASQRSASNVSSSMKGSIKILVKCELANGRRSTLRNSRLGPVDTVASCDSRNSSVTKTTKCRSQQRHSKGEDAKKARKQVIKMLILVIVLFQICWGSRIIMGLLIKVNVISYTQAMYTLRFVLYALPFIHSCINPLIYSFMSKNFRRSLKRQLIRFGCMRIQQRGKPILLLKIGTRNPIPGVGSSSSTYCPSDTTRNSELESIVSAI